MVPSVLSKNFRSFRHHQECNLSKGQTGVRIITTFSEPEAHLSSYVWSRTALSWPGLVSVSSRSSSYNACRCCLSSISTFVWQLSGGQMEQVLGCSYWFLPLLHYGRPQSPVTLGRREWPATTSRAIERTRIAGRTWTTATTSRDAGMEEQG